MPETVLAALRNYGKAFHAFPYLPHDDEDLIEIIAAPEYEEDVELEIELDQAVSALEYYLDNEQEICQNLIGVLCQYLELMCQQDPLWFDEFVDNVSEQTVRDAIQLYEASFALSPNQDEVLLGMAFHCDWDVEHGMTILLHRGEVVEIGSIDSLSSPSGMLPQELRGKAWQELFGEFVEAHEAQMKSAMEAMLSQRRQCLQKVSQNTSYGPALRELSRILIEHPHLTASITFDVPADQAMTKPQMPILPAQSLKGLEQMLHLLPAEMKAAFEGVSEGIQHEPVVEVSMSLGGPVTMWNYANEISTHRIDDGNWPDVFAAIKRKWPGARPRLNKVQITGHDQQAEEVASIQAALVAALEEYYS